MSENVSPFNPCGRQKRLENWTCSFELVPMPSSLIATIFSGSNPAWERSTEEERRIENGSARTTLSAVTFFLPDACANVSVYVPVALRFTATSSEPVVIWPARRAASRSVIWSFPPATWYFSSEAPKTRNWPWPR